MTDTWIKTPEEMKLMEKSCQILAHVMRDILPHVKPGITTKQLDTIAEKLMLDHHVKPGFKGYRDFPAVICTSVNDEIVHVIPSDRVLEDGDILSIDAGVIYEGFNSDMAVTVSVGAISKEAQRLIDVTKESLARGIDQVRPGVHVGEISYAIETFVKEQGYDVVRDLVGHGIGRALHEDPPIPNFGPKKAGPLLREGMCIAIEPMVVSGSPEIVADGWRIATKDGELSAHFEHTIGIFSDGGHILTEIA